MTTAEAVARAMAGTVQAEDADALAGLPPPEIKQLLRGCPDSAVQDLRGHIQASHGTARLWLSASARSIDAGMLLEAVRPPHPSEILEIADIDAAPIAQLVSVTSGDVLVSLRRDSLACLVPTAVWDRLFTLSVADLVDSTVALRTAMAFRWLRLLQAPAISVTAQIADGSGVRDFSGRVRCAEELESLAARTGGCVVSSDPGLPRLASLPLAAHEPLVQLITHQANPAGEE